MRAEIISIGSELLLGEITDTNAAFLASQLPLLGIDLYWISQVGDNHLRIIEVLKRAWERSDLILTGGGLGPTDDDITREAIAGMLGEKITVEPSLEAHLRTRFTRMGTEMPVSNLRQATIIPSAKAIPNTQGTAPGWWAEKDGRILVTMPGPSNEMQEMWRQEVLPRLQRRSEAIILSRTLKTFDLSEAAVGEAVAALMASANPTLGVYAKSDGIHLRLTAKAENQKKAESMLADGEAQIRAILGKYIWGTDSDTLEAITGEMLTARGLNLATMEDSSRGQLAASFASAPGSQSFYKGGLVACSDEAKKMLGVDGSTVSRYGAASAELAQAMAEAARTLLKADIGLSINGVEETPSRPTGTVYIGIADNKGCKATGRNRRRQITIAALAELRKWLISQG